MKKTLLLLSAICLFLSCLSQALAQTPPTETTQPPPVLLIVREEIKPGKMSDHEKESNRFTQVLTKAKSQWGRLGMTPIAGNENEVMYLWGFDSFADMEKYNQALEGWSGGALKADFDRIAPGPEDLHQSQRDMLAVLRPDLSYQPGVNIATMRYMRVTGVRVKPGQYMNFLAAAQMYLDALKKANVDEHSAVYQVVSGTGEGLYYIFTPMKSLAEMDTIPARFKPYQAAMGVDGLKALEKMFAEALNPGESGVYIFNPRMSYVSPQFAARDTSTPAFWNPKPQ